MRKEGRRVERRGECRKEEVRTGQSRIGGGERTEKERRVERRRGGVKREEEGRGERREGRRAEARGTKRLSGGLLKDAGGEGGTQSGADEGEIVRWAAFLSAEVMAEGWRYLSCAAIWPSHQRGH